jgi:DNA-binding NarL/FixJ family response regulator
MNLSLGTVKVHVHSIIRKLNVRNRTQVVVASRRAPTSAPVNNAKLE